MAFREAVFTEALDLLKAADGELFGQAVFDHAVDELAAEAENLIALAFPGSHGAPEFICLAWRESGRLDRQGHALLLKKRHTQGLAQHGIDITTHSLRNAGWKRFDLFGTGAAAEIWVHHAALDGPGADDGHFDYQVIELFGFETRQHRHLSTTLDLEHPDGVGFWIIA